MRQPKLTTLHERLRFAAGSRNYRQVAEVTNTNHETVRRYMSGQTPSVRFLEATCKALDLNADWLLIGNGPMTKTEQAARNVMESSVSASVATLSNTVALLIERVRRLEASVEVIKGAVRSHAEGSDQDPRPPSSREIPKPLHIVEVLPIERDIETPSTGSQLGGERQALRSNSPKRFSPGGQ